MKTTKWSRTPSAQDIASFDGLHCGRAYRWAVANSWRCPSCGRTAQECIRWSEIRGQFWRSKYADEWGMGWTISLTRHHCHGVGGRRRFETTLICGDCNSADGTAKRKLSLPQGWSFSPSEIARFVQCTRWSGRVEIDYRTAAEIYTTAMCAAEIAA